MSYHLYRVSALPQQGFKETAILPERSPHCSPPAQNENWPFAETWLQSDDVLKGLLLVWLRRCFSSQLVAAFASPKTRSLLPAKSHTVWQSRYFQISIHTRRLWWWWWWQSFWKAFDIELHSEQCLKIKARPQNYRVQRKDGRLHYGLVSLCRNMVCIYSETYVCLKALERSNAVRPDVIISRLMYRRAAVRFNADAS